MINHVHCFSKLRLFSAEENFETCGRTYKQVTGKANINMDVCHRSQGRV